MNRKKETKTTYYLAAFNQWLGSNGICIFNHEHADFYFGNFYLRTYNRNTWEYETEIYDLPDVKEKAREAYERNDEITYVRNGYPVLTGR